ncbi:MAG: DUF3817 domain-containing protein [Bacteroidetes Order II. Incertae sedis bacterium]|nr:DUF3817 domain-containing protein [Bacteroidetes Order II. bacterium]
MFTLLQNNLGRLRIIGFVEGWSYLILLFVAMPLKYIWEMPVSVRVMGTIHGALFVFFMIYVTLVWYEKNHSWSWAIKSFVASIVPFGTFWADKHLFQQNTR